MGKLFINCDNRLIDGDLLGNAVYKVLRQKVNLSAEITFCNEEEIRKINSEQRNIDKVTDVLSFPAAGITAGEVVKRRNYPFDIDPERNAVFLGCITICEKRAEEQAEEYGHSFEREVYYLATHGLLHLFGYDHMCNEDKEVMRAQEELILSEIALLSGDKTIDRSINGTFENSDGENTEEENGVFNSEIDNKKTLDKKRAEGDL